MNGTTSMKLISDGASVDITARDESVFEIWSGELLLGFVEQAGRVFVALSGARYDRAVEAGQALSLSMAASLLASAPAEDTAPQLQSAA